MDLEIYKSFTFAVVAVFSFAEFQYISVYDRLFIAAAKIIQIQKH